MGIFNILLIIFYIFPLGFCFYVAYAIGVEGSRYRKLAIKHTNGGPIVQDRVILILIAIVPIVNVSMPLILLWMFLQPELTRKI